MQRSVVVYGSNPAAPQLNSDVASAYRDMVDLDMLSRSAQRYPCFRLATLIVASGGYHAAAGQGGVAVPAGARVRVQRHSPSAVDVRRCTAVADTTLGDTLLLVAPRSCSYGTYEADLWLARGERGSRVSHAVEGFLAGALGGGVIARVAAGDGCRVPHCDEGGFAVGIFTMFGAAAGAVVGTVVGAVLPAGTRWAAGSIVRTVHVDRGEREDHDW